MNRNPKAGINNILPVINGMNLYNKPMFKKPKKLSEKADILFICSIREFDNFAGGS